MILSALMGFGSISTDFYLPALPTMASSLRSASGTIELRRYCLLFGLGVIGLIAASLVNARLVPRFGSGRLLLAGTSGAAVAGIVLAVDACTGLGGLASLALPLFCFVCATGFIVANAVAGALAVMPDRAGTVSAFVGTIQYGGGILGSALTGALLSTRLLQPTGR